MHYLYCIFLTTFTLGRICLKFITNSQNNVNKRESRYTIKGTYWNMSKSSKGFLITNLIAFVELYIKMHKCNSLMNNRRIVIVNVVKIIQKLQAWPTWWIKTAVDSKTLFQDRRRAIQSFFWIKDFSWKTISLWLLWQKVY